VSSVLLVFLRSDGIFWVGVCIALAGFTLLRRRIDRGFGVALTTTLVVVGAVIALSIFRFAYFSELLPNTTYAKMVQGSESYRRGFYYGVSFLLHMPHLLIVLVLGLAATRAKGKIQLLIGQCVALIVAGFAYAILVGGDFMAMGRFFVPLMPFFALMFAVCVKELFRSQAVTGAMVSFCLVFSLLANVDVNIVPGSVRDLFHFRWNQSTQDTKSEIQYWNFMVENSQKWERLGKVLAKYTDEGDSLVQTAIGAVGYYSGLHIYDRFGLVDKDVARREVTKARFSPGHDKFVPFQYFLKYKPTYLHASLENEYSRIRVSDILERSNIPGYEVRCREITFENGGSDGEYLCVYARH
jgi:hypothetical protein